MAVRNLGTGCCRAPGKGAFSLRRRVVMLAAAAVCSLVCVATSLRFSDAFGHSVTASATEDVVAWPSGAFAPPGRPPLRVQFGGAGGAGEVGGVLSTVAAAPLLERTADAAVLRAATALNYVGCLRYRWQLLSRHRAVIGDMTPTQCVRLCGNRGYDYAALMGGTTCHCSVWTGAGQLQLPAADGTRRCRTPCGGDSVLRCGGVGEYADVYSVHSGDGGSDETQPWTTWMTTVSRLSKDAGAAADYASRYRECRRTRETFRSARPMGAAAETGHRCVTAVQRRMGAGDGDGGRAAAAASDAAELRAELDRYVGCFVFGREPTVTEVHVVSGQSSPESERALPLVCSVLCGARSAAYALVTAHDGRCRCADSLGVARPFYRCGPTPPGVAVYFAVASPATSTTSGSVVQQDTMQLVFDAAPRHRRKVLLLLHGGGSRSFVLSRLLAADERVTHAVDPERAVFGDVDTPAAAAAVVAAAARASMSRLLSLHLNCDSQRLPAAWLAAVVGAPRSAYEVCRRYHTASGEPCAAAYRASCEASAVVSAASALLTNAAELQQFVNSNNDTTVFLVARDPLAVAALLKKSLLRGGARGRGARITASRAASLCASLKQTRAAAIQLARSGSAVYRMHFESAGDDVAAVALAFYRRLRFRRGGSGRNSSYEAPEPDERERVLRLAANLFNRTDQDAAADPAGGGVTPRTAGVATAAASDDTLPLLSDAEIRAVEDACSGFVYGE